MSDDDLIKIEEVAFLVGCNIQTLNYYYRFKRENPDNGYAELLPDYIQSGSRSTRYWRRGDIKDIIEFRKRIPKGRGGALGSVTQRRHNQDSKSKINTDNQSVNNRANGWYIRKITSILKENGVEEDSIRSVHDILVSEYEWRTGLRYLYDEKV